MQMDRAATRSILLCKNNFSDYDAISSCPAAVHRLYPVELISGFQLFGHAFGSGEPGGNELDLFLSFVVDIDKVL